MIELVCRRCGAPFIPTKGDLLRGAAWYRDCPSCRVVILGSPVPQPSERLPPQSTHPIRRASQAEEQSPARSVPGTRSRRGRT